MAETSFQAENSYFTLFFPPITSVLDLTKYRISFYQWNVFLMPVAIGRAEKWLKPISRLKTAIPYWIQIASGKRWLPRPGFETLTIEPCDVELYTGYK